MNREEAAGLIARCNEIGDASLKSKVTIKIMVGESQQSIERFIDQQVLTNGQRVDTGTMPRSGDALSPGRQAGTITSFRQIDDQAFFNTITIMKPLWGAFEKRG